MPDEAIAAAHERAVEQVMSDERLLGVLPDDLSRRLLDWVRAQIGQAAERAPNVEAFRNEVDAIRHRARTLADASADAGDDAVAFIDRLQSADAVSGNGPSESIGIDQQHLPTATIPIETGQQRSAPVTDSVPNAEHKVLAPAPTIRRSAEPMSAPVAQHNGSVATPHRPRPPIATSLRSSLRRSLRRFRDLLRAGGSH
jgi:hypothetical protein